MLNFQTYLTSHMMSEQIQIIIPGKFFIYRMEDKWHEAKVFTTSQGLEKGAMELRFDSTGKTFTDDEDMKSHYTIVKFGVPFYVPGFGEVVLKHGKNGFSLTSTEK